MTLALMPGLSALALGPATPSTLLRHTGTNPRHAPACCNILEDIRLQISAETKFVRGAGGLVEQPVFFDGGEDTPFDMARWEIHRSSNRYGRLIPGILVGATTRRIASTVAGFVVFAALVGVYNGMAMSGSAETTLGFALPPIQLPLTPFELTSPVLGLLLVFRTDAATDRFNTGCEAVWEITSSHRSIIRKLVAWTSRESSTDAERDAARSLIAGCLLLHDWIMCSYLRGRPLKASQEAQLLKYAAGRDDVQRVNVMNELIDGQVARTPYLAITALSLGACRRLPSLTDQEQVSIDEEFGVITKALGECETLLRTPIPLGYTRYSVRFSWLWLSLLPFALVKTFSEFSANTWWADKPQPALALAMLFVCFVFLSIEDIAVQIEEPFSVLPLNKCHKWLAADARRMLLLVLNPSDIYGGHEKNEATTSWNEPR